MPVKEPADKEEKSSHKEAPEKDSSEKKDMKINVEEPSEGTKESSPRSYMRTEEVEEPGVLPSSAPIEVTPSRTPETPDINTQETNQPRSAMITENQPTAAQDDMAGKKFFNQKPAFNTGAPNTGIGMRPTSVGGFSAPKESKGSKLHLFILLLVGIGAILAIVYLLKGEIPYILPAKQAASPAPSSAPTSETTDATPAPTASASATSTIERGDFSVRVLNGSGKSGLAKTVSDKLKELGYEIDRVGNATESDVAVTSVRVKEGSNSASLLAQLIKDLASDYEASGSTDLKSTDPADAEVIIGLK